MALNLTIELIGRFQRFQESLDQVVKNTERGAERLEKSFHGFTRLVTLGFVAHEVKEFVSSVLEAGAALEQSQARVQAALRATGEAAGVTKDEIEEFAKATQRSSRFDDEGARNAAAALLRFRNVQGDVFREALELIPDVAEGLGVELPEAAAKLGLALQDPIHNLRGLREVMSKLSEEQADNIARLVEQGKLYQAQKLLLEQVRGGVGGLARDINQGLTKSTRDLTKAWEDFKKALATTPVVKDPVVNTLNYISQAFQDLDEDIENIKKAKGAIETANAVGAALDPSRARIRTEQTRDAKEVVEATTKEERERIRKAQQGEEEQRAREARDQAYREQQRQIHDAVALAEVRVGIETQAERRAAQQKTEVLEDQYQRGLVATEDYYAARLAIQQRGLQQEIRGIDQAIKAQRDLLAAKSTPIEAQAGIKARIEALQGRRADLVKELQFAPVEVGIEAARAQETFQDSLVQTNAQLLEQLGLSEKAAAAARDLNSFKHEAARIDAEIAAGRAKPEDKAAFQAIQQEKELRGALTEAVAREELAKQRLNTQEEIADTARLQRGQTYEAERQFLEDQRRIHLQLVPVLQREADELEKIAAQTPLIEGKQSPQAQALQAQAAAKRAQAEKIQAENSGAVAASQDLQLELSKYNRLLEEEANKEEEINNLRERGAITELEKIAKIDAARKASLESLRQEYEILKAKAEESKKPDDILAAERARLAYERLAASADQMGKTIREAFEGSLIDPLDDFIFHVKDAGDAFNAFVNNIVHALARIAEQSIAQEIFGTDKSGAAGIGGGIAGFIAKLFGGSGAAGASTTAAVNVAAFSSAGGNVMTPYGPAPLERYAEGGIARRPTVSLFGEGRTPEAYVPLPDGRSIPVSLKGAVPQQQQVQQITFNVQTPDAASFRRSEGQIMTSLALGARRALARR